VEPIRLANVGCGSTGGRHLAGQTELARCGVLSVDQVTVVSGVTVRRAVALVYAQFESALAGRPVMIAEVEIDEYCGWLA
jgi:hypothetical protein